jgi:hypothetical protein
LVWYLLMALTFRKPQTAPFTVDLNAPVSTWEFVASYYSAANCRFAEGDLVETANQYPNLIGFTPYASPATTRASRKNKQ